MYFKRQEFSLGDGFEGWWMKGMTKTLGVSRAVWNFLNVCVSGLFCVWMLLIYISWKNALITGNFKEQSHSVEFYKVDHAKGLWCFVKLMKHSMGGWSVLCSFFYVLSIWKVVSWILVYVIYLDLGVYVTKCNLGFGFFWKFNVVLGLCGLK
jgi:hypothetical protein